MLVALVLLAQASGLATADEHYRSGRFEEAHRAYERLLADHSENPGLRLRLGVVRYELRRYAEAEGDFRVALDAVPEMHPALVGLGTTLIALNRTAESIPVLERAVGLVPADPMGRRALGHAFALESDLVRGEPLLRQLVAENPADDEAWLYLATLLFQNNYNLAALQSFDKHLGLRPGNVAARIYRAGALAQLGRLEEAAREFRALAAEPVASASTDYLLGHAQLLFRTQRYSEALARIDAAIGIDRDSAKLSYWRARILAYLERTDEALAEAERSVGLDPNVPGSRVLLLKLYGRSGEREKVAEMAAWLRRYENRVARGAPR